jgi:peptidyl-tRNA hydrolase, PTH1 family
LIVGLGNPGPNYQHNRHNVGQMVLDELARRMGASFKSHKTSSQISEGRLNQSKVVLAKSNGYMNTSGAPVAALCKFFSVEPDQLIVIHDELDIPFGELRTKFSGGHAGHNGLRDIIAHLGNDYHRVRFGIGRPPGQMEVSDFVLQNFSTVERKELDVLIALAADKVEELVAPKLLQ